MTTALETIRRLRRRGRERPQEERTPTGGTPGLEGSLSASPGGSLKATETPEDFVQRIREAQARVGAVYPAGLLESLSEAEGGLLDEPEERMEAALRAGDLEAAGAALVEWERRWTETIRKREAGGGE